MFIVKIYNFTTNKTEVSEVFPERAVADAIVAKMNAAGSHYRHAWVEPLMDQAAAVPLLPEKFYQNLRLIVAHSFEGATCNWDNGHVSFRAKSTDQMLAIIEWLRGERNAHNWDMQSLRFGDAGVSGAYVSIDRKKEVMS